MAETSFHIGSTASLSVAVARFKAHLAKQILLILDRNIFPGIKERVAFTEVISSVDIEHETGGERGNAYGRRLSVTEILKGRSVRTIAR